MSKKPWYCSKTLWLNIVVVMLAVAESHFNLLQPVLPVNFYAAVAFFLPVLNAALRLITSQALSLGSEP